MVIRPRWNVIGPRWAVIGPRWAVIRRRLALLVSLHALVLGSFGCGEPTLPSPPHILLILADDLGIGDPGYLGSEINTPNLDRLSREGLCLERFYAQPECTPSRAALLSGRHPIRFGLSYSVLRPWSKNGVPEEETLLSTTLRKAGYRTALVGKWHLGHERSSQRPLSRGFDHFYGHLNGRIDYYSHEVTHAESKRGPFGLDWQRNGKTIREDGYSTDLLARETVRLLEETDDARGPLFLLLSFNAPHPPLQAPALDPAADPAPLGGNRGTYAAMVEALDQGVGDVLDALDRNDLDRKTLLIFLSDNGSAPKKGGSNRPFSGGKASCFEGGIRVPAIVRWPGRIPAGTRSNRVTSILDLYPTLLSAAGLSPESPERNARDGEDLWDFFLDPNSEARGERELFFACQSRSKRRDALLRGAFKVVRETDVLTGEQTTQLFDVIRDPGETRDLAGTHSRLREELEGGIRRWTDLHPESYVRPSYHPPSGWVAPVEWASSGKP